MARIDDSKLETMYLEDLKKQDKTPKSIENYISVLRIFRQYLAKKHKTFTDISGDNNKVVLEDFLLYLRDERNLSYARIKVYYSALSNFYEFLEYKGFIKKNIVLSVRKRYVRQFKNGYIPETRKIIEIEDMSKLLNGIPVLKDKCIALLLIKTGVRRAELINMDIDDIDFSNNEIELKKKLFHKRSNLTVYFDDETASMLKKWLKRRETIAKPGEKALFVSDIGTRLQRHGISDTIVRWTTIMGYHNPRSKKLKDHFTPHNFRHCFTTYLQRAGMPREFIQELRGDKRGEIIDIYTHIDPKELKKSYLSCMPKFNVY